jgi:SEC-C motif-containing protein
LDISSPCPCGRPLRYADCCKPAHDGVPATTAEALMCSRYSAYVLGLEDYLLATWHPTTRPAALDLASQSPAPTWLGLSVKEHRADGDRATVEFVARMRVGGGSARRQHELSRFLREGGRWFYVDGDLRP